MDRCVLLASPGDAAATAIVLLRGPAAAADAGAAGDAGAGTAAAAGSGAATADAGAAAVLLEMRGVAAAAGLRSWEVRRRVLADQGCSPTRVQAAALYTQAAAP